MAVAIESEQVAKGLDGNDGAGDGILLRHSLLKKELQGFPGAATQIGKKIPLIGEVPAQDLRDAEDEMPVGNLLEHVGTEPFPEFHHPLLMAGGTEMTALAGEGQKIFMMAIPALYPGKAVVQAATIQVPVNDFLEVGPPEPVRPFEPLLVDLDKGFKMVLHTPVKIRRLRVPGTVNGGRSGHDSSPPRKSRRHNILYHPFCRTLPFRCITPSLST